MEFTFWCPDKGGVMTLDLRDFDLIVTVDKEKRIVPYACVTQIKLGRRRNNYSIEIYALDKDVVRVQCFSSRLTMEPLLQKRSYHTFVRILHLHLQKKSTSSFVMVRSLSESILKFAGLAALLMLLFFIEMQFHLLNSKMFPWFVLLSSAFIFVIPFVRWPRSYVPSNIPLNMLPSPF